MYIYIYIQIQLCMGRCLTHLDLPSSSITKMKKPEEGYYIYTTVSNIYIYIYRRDNDQKISLLVSRVRTCFAWRLKTQELWSVLRAEEWILIARLKVTIWLP